MSNDRTEQLMVGKRMLHQLVMATSRYQTAQVSFTSYIITTTLTGVNDVLSLIHKTKDKNSEQATAYLQPTYILNVHLVSIAKT